MTEPGFVAPSPTGWWARKDRIGINENETDWVTSTTGVKPNIDYRPTMRIANPRVGPQAMRNKFRRNPRVIRFIPGGSTPAFDAIGAGAAASGTSWSWSHTIGSAAKAIIVVGTEKSSAAWMGVTGTVGGVAMDILGHQYHYSDGTYYGTWVLGLLNPPTGAQTVAISSTTSSQSCMNSISYTNTSAFDECIYQGNGGVDGNGSTWSAPGGGNTGTMTASATKPNQIFVGGFNALNSTTAWSGVAPTQRFKYDYSSSVNMPFIVGEAPNGNTLTATNASSINYGSLGAQLSSSLMPSYGAMGATASSGGGNISWSHTAKAGDYVIAAFVVQYGSATPVLSSITYGASNMTVLGSIAFNGDNTHGIMWVCGIAGVSAGAQTITPTITNGNYIERGTSLSFRNAASATLGGTNMYGYGTGSKTLATTCNADQLIVCAMGSQGNASMSAPTGGITRYFVAGNPNLLISTASTPTTFGVNPNNDYYGGLYVVLSST